ncbi:MAG: cytochrome C [Bacteroidetes bacterium 43-16]|nr:MAG: cytochrome C [Bacteroidetes bacterium 43-16]
MKKAIKPVLTTLFFAFLVSQFFQPAPNTDNGKVYTTDFIRYYQTPVEVSKILRRSCYDCHSNNTNYLWYDYVQPGRWLVEKHISEAKNELNFNEWGNYAARKQERLLRSIEEQIKTEQMPLWSYTLVHKNAELNKEEIEVLIKWLKEQP